jgi:hypothetical protein
MNFFFIYRVRAFIRQKYYSEKSFTKIEKKNKNKILIFCKICAQNEDLRKLHIILIEELSFGLCTQECNKNLISAEKKKKC